MLSSVFDGFRSIVKGISEGRCDDDTVNYCHIHGWRISTNAGRILSPIASRIRRRLRSFIGSSLTEPEKAPVPPGIEEDWGRCPTAGVRCRAVGGSAKRNCTTNKRFANTVANHRNDRRIVSGGRRGGSFGDRRDRLGGESAVLGEAGLLAPVPPGLEKDWGRCPVPSVAGGSGVVVFLRRTSEKHVQIIMLCEAFKEPLTARNFGCPIPIPS